MSGGVKVGRIHSTEFPETQFWRVKVTSRVRTGQPFFAVSRSLSSSWDEALGPCHH